MEGPGVEGRGAGSQGRRLGGRLGVHPVPCPLGWRRAHTGQGWRPREAAPECGEVPRMHRDMCRPDTQTKAWVV